MRGSFYFLLKTFLPQKVVKTPSIRGVFFFHFTQTFCAYLWRFIQSRASLTPWHDQRAVILEGTQVFVFGINHRAMKERASCDQKIRCRNWCSTQTTDLRQIIRQLPRRMLEGQARQDILQLLHVLPIFDRASPHPEFGQNNGTSNDGAVLEQFTHALLDGRISAAAEKVDPTGGVDERHSGISRTRKESSCAAVIKVDESPKRSANDRMRPRRAKSPKAASTAARLVFAPETRMASSRRSAGISKVVFIWIKQRQYMYKSSQVYALLGTFAL